MKYLSYAVTMCLFSDGYSMLNQSEHLVPEKYRKTVDDVVSDTISSRSDELTQGLNDRILMVK